uniref:Uncharacterized protein n=1 Tax=Amphimedon queenslandica TaxID=400682 RepID=A0A1X7TUG9_AMPQE
MDLCLFEGGYFTRRERIQVMIEDLLLRWVWTLTLSVREGGLGVLNDDTCSFCSGDISFDPHGCYDNGESCLYAAARGSHVDIVEYLIKECYSYPMKTTNTEYGWTTVLHYVAREGLLDVLKCMVMHINGHIMDEQYRDTNGRTVLHLAVKHIDVVKYLINECKYDIMATDRSKYGNTILHDAASQGSLDVMKYLINTHHYDLMTNNSDVVKYLINECNCDIMVTDKDGQTPLHYAARRGTPEVIEYFLSTGNCDPLAKDYEGKTPLQLAKGRQDDSDTVIAIFKKFGDIKISHPIDSYVNVFLVGNSGAGKSTLSHVINMTTTGSIALGSFRNAAKVDPCTAGIKPYKLEHMELGNIILHDFAGHPEYYSSHSAVIENLLQGSGGVFLIVVNVLEKEAVKQLHQWLTVVRNEAQKVLNQCHVIVIVSHVDEISNPVERRRKEEIEIIVKERCDRVSCVFLDCRKLGGSGVNSFFKKSSIACKSIHSKSGRNLSLYCHMMYGLLGKKKKDILTLSDVMAASRCSNDYVLPDKREDILDVLDLLYSTGLISVLKSEEKVWVVANKDILLTQVNGILFAPETFKEHVDIASNTGIVSVSGLTRLFPKYDPDMLICFLKNMELCQEMNPSFLRMTNLIEGDGEKTGDSASETQRREKRLLFFPCLLSTDRPDEMTSQVYQFGWCLQCTREHHFFPPRYFHVLSLHLAFKFSLSQGNKELAEKLNRKCKFWSNGLHWFDGYGVKVLVEIVDESHNLSLLGGRDIKEAIDITEEFNTPLTPEPTSQNKSSSASSSTQINESDLDIKGDGGVKCNNNKDKGTTTNTLNESQKHGSTSIEKGQSDIDVVKIDDKLQEIRTDKLLDIRDLATVIQELTSNHQFDYTNWKQLGLYLGLYQPTLKAIEVNCRGQVWECLMECLSSWLKGEDGVRDTRGGGSNWISLVAALDAIGEREVANNIRIKYKL